VVGKVNCHKKNRLKFQPDLYQTKLYFFIYKLLKSFKLKYQQS